MRRGRMEVRRLRREGIVELGLQMTLRVRGNGGRLV